MAMDGPGGYKIPPRVPEKPEHEHPASKISSTATMVFWRIFAAAILLVAFFAVRSQAESESELNGNGESSFLWFGPRLGRRDPGLRGSRPGQSLDNEQNRRLAEFWQWQQRNAGYA